MLYIRDISQLNKLGNDQKQKQIVCNYCSLKLLGVKTNIV